MRTAFIETLCELAEEDQRIWLLCGDLGYSVLERFVGRFPDRFVNCGVAEQNMTGIAAGLAMSGKVVFTYSIANFPVMRCLEQIRNDVCYHNLNVKIVAVGGGVAYGSAGYTHHALEDLAVMRSMPNMNVVAPGDPVETLLATRAIAGRDGPCYLRLGKAGEPVVHRSTPHFAIGSAIKLRDGNEVAVLSTGGTLEPVIRAAELCGRQRRSVAVYSVPWVKPLDEKLIRELAATIPLVITVEEARASGGLGGAVAEVIAGHPVPRARLVQLGFTEVQVSDSLLYTVQSQKAARTSLGLDVPGLAQRIMEAMA